MAHDPIRASLLKRAQEKKNKIGSPAIVSMQKEYYWNPLGWIQKYVDITLPAYHIKTLSEISPENCKIAIVGPHGLGKSVIAALLVLWCGTVSPDCKIITTASVWAQLEKFLWPEIHKWFARTNWQAVGFKPDLLNLMCKFSPQSTAFALSPDKPESMEGGHAVRIFYLFDEAKVIPSGFWEAAEGAFSTIGDHIQIALSTPGDTSGVFYNICSRQHGYEKWKVRHVTFREAVRAGRISIDWAREKRRAWGKDSMAYQTRVWGRFATDAPDCVIPLEWIERAVARWRTWKDNGCVTTGTLIIGADTAGQGVDKTVFAYKYNKILAKLERFGKSRPMEIAGSLKVKLGVTGIVNIDTSFGEGVGTADRLLEYPELKNRVNKIQFGSKTDKRDRTGQIEFKNTRALLWWNMRELLDPDNHEDIALPDDELLIGDLAAVKRLPFGSDGRLCIEPKEDIKKRIGRSPDDGDACCLAFLTVSKPSTCISVF